MAKTKYNISLILFASGFILFAFFFNPFQPVKLAVCPFLTLTGLYCPGCGSLRSIHSLLHGNLTTALNHNTVVVLITPFLIVLAFKKFRASKNKTASPEILIKPIWIWLLFTTIMLFWILRNLKTYPMNTLAPG